MASNAKKKTTMAKLNRERKLRERRAEKQAKKEARRQASADLAVLPEDAPSADEGAQSDADPDALDNVAQAPDDA
jgi:hypothetical protein